MMLFIILTIAIILPTHSIYQSRITFSSLGHEFQPRYNDQLISNVIIQSRTRCSALCNQQPSCYTFDYDSTSRRCRLFEADLTTGSIISSGSLNSIVGTVVISPSLFTSINTQSCQACQESRYEICSTNGSICECTPNTYWNGTICSLQLFENDTCTQIDACRTDLNLTCATDCYGRFTICSPVSTSIQPNVTTVAGSCNGFCNETMPGNQTTLHSQHGIFGYDNGTLYVADGPPVNKILVFEPNNLAGRPIISFTSWPTYIFVDNRTSNIYVTLFAINSLQIWPSNTTIPPTVIGSACTMNELSTPTSAVVDSAGNVYICSYACNWVTKWTPNAPNGTLVAGSPTAAVGTDSQHLHHPYGFSLDEENSLLYVADFFNHRIQKFTLGNLTGVTVAGGNGAGMAPNQLHYPRSIILSKIDGALYICDSSNDRVQKWAMNALFGVTVAGSTSGIPGSTPYLLSGPYDIWVDSNENYLLVSDSNNCRVQKYYLR